MTNLPQTIDEALARVSEPAKEYYRKFAAFQRGYNISYSNMSDFEQFKNDLPILFELASVGLIEWIKVIPPRPCDACYSKNQLYMEAMADAQLG